MGFISDKAKKQELKEEDWSEIRNFLNGEKIDDFRDAKLALEYATVNGHEELIELLLNKGISYFAQTEEETFANCPMYHLITGTLGDGKKIDVNLQLFRRLNGPLAQISKSDTSDRLNLLLFDAIESLSDRTLGTTLSGVRNKLPGMQGWQLREEVKHILVAPIEGAGRVLGLTSQEPFNPTKMDNYKLYATACFHTALHVRLSGVSGELKGYGAFFSTYSQFSTACFERAAVLGHLLACRDVADFHRVKSQVGREILYKLAACSNEEEARACLMSLKDIDSSRKKKRKGLCEYLLGLPSDDLPYGAPMAFHRFLQLADKEFPGASNNLKSSFKDTGNRVKEIIARAGFSQEFIRSMTEHQLAAQSSDSKKDKTQSSAHFSATLFYPTGSIVHAVEPTASEQLRH